MEVNHQFDMEQFSKSQRVMKCARQLFGSPLTQEAWALKALEVWQSTGKSPERQRDERNPHWKKTLEVIERRIKTKVLYY